MISNIKAPTRTGPHRQGRRPEAAFRMLQNDIDAEVLEEPDALVVDRRTGDDVERDAVKRGFAAGVGS